MIKKRTANYRQDTEPVKQKFSVFKDEFRYNKTSKKLEYTGNKIDVQALVDSYADTALNRVIAKFLQSPDGETIQDVIDDTNTDLDFITGVSTEISELKERQGLDENASFEDIEKYLRDKAQKYYDALKTKGGVNDEKKETVETQEQA